MMINNALNIGIQGIQDGMQGVEGAARKIARGGVDGPRGTADGGSIIAQAGGPPVSAGDHVAVFVRPEAVRLARTAEAVADLENHIAVSVESVLFNGANSRVLVRTPGHNRELDVAVEQCRSK